MNLPKKIHKTGRRELAKGITSTLTTMARPSSPAKQAVAQRAAAKQVLETLQSLQSANADNITIIKISEPISSALNNSNNNDAAAATVRTSDVSNSSLDSPTPASLEADLLHYRELFAKLRFSYVEQVTKEKFIRAIVGDPPLIVTPQENADLEASNALAKADLKALKTEVTEMVAELEARGRQLASRYEQVQVDTATLHDLVTESGKMAELEAKIGVLRAGAQAANNTSENHNQDREEMGEMMNLTLEKTAALVKQRRAMLQDLDRQLEQLEERLAPRRQKELERLQAEVATLETKRANATAAAREAKRRRENLAQGGVEDDLEARGRWYRASEVALRQMLDVKEGVRDLAA
ncbi:hypothetical protein B0H66DRAFT_469646 [Apodospora peruviana]|uniref:Kinetochore protein Sos7 coiled-coil domain-containing protein n=1 Tax=Apodospora peruviana TaxID=516989 RepID=A0AAE0MFY9_9PEZI|nr:hypothetical protein B0H66DRAFT_469646 [Apodospora peruviana]